MAEQESTAVHVDVAVLKSDMATLKKDVSEIKTDVKTLLLTQAASGGAASSLKTIALQIIPFVALVVSIGAVLAR